MLKAALYTAMHLCFGREFITVGKCVTTSGADGGRTRTHLQHVYTDLHSTGRQLSGIEVLTP